MTQIDLREGIVAAARALTAHNLNRGAAGNVSARWNEGFLVTPTGLACDEMQAGDIVPMMMDGRSGCRGNAPGPATIGADRCLPRCPAGAAAAAGHHRVDVERPHQRGAAPLEVVVALPSLIRTRRCLVAPVRTRRPAASPGVVAAVSRHAVGEIETEADSGSAFPRTRSFFWCSRARRCSSALRSAAACGPRRSS